MPQMDNFENLEQNSQDKETSDCKKCRCTDVTASIMDYVEIFVSAIAIVILLFSFLLRVCSVKGPSMENTLFEGETLIISDFLYTPSRGDIIVFHQTGSYNEPIVKRVIATGGETVDIDFKTWTVTVTDTNGNSFVVDEEYMYLEGGHAVLTSDIQYPYIVPDGHLFVMGDNRNHSSDSRSALIGPVDERRVLGKVIFRLTPFEKIGTVD